MSPQLPAGYATMLVLALVPPLWRRVMDHRVLTWYDGDVSRANVRRGYRCHAARAGGVLPEPDRSPANHSGDRGDQQGKDTDN